MIECTVAEALATAFASKGVKHIYGVPGGGSSLDVIEAAAKKGIEFILTRTENAAVMMAAVSAELSGTLGVALTTKGPGSANAANGVACASLECLPVVLLTDGFTRQEQTYITHQVFDQKAMLAPITKGHSRLEGKSAARDINHYIEIALTAPYGPVHFELTGDAAKTMITIEDRVKSDMAGESSTLSENDSVIKKANELISMAEYPIIIVGMESREANAAKAIRELVRSLGCPALTTYKAKGVISDNDTFFAGIFTGGSNEADCVNNADLIILCGVDPVEFIRQPWRYEAPVIDISLVKHSIHYLTSVAGLYGPISESISRFSSTSTSNSWKESDIADLRQAMHDRVRCNAVGGINPQQVVEFAVEESGNLHTNPRITVDAGAHMFSAMEFWPCNEPYDVLISNGLATMAFALPAAVASALQDCGRPVIAFTGDGGLLMCIGELITAVQCKANITVIVFNDASLSLIDIKQQERQLPTRGMRWKRPSFAKMIEGMGGQGYTVATLEEYKGALTEALHLEGPALIDVAVDATGYSDQLKAMRG